MDNNWNEHYIKRGDPNAPTYYIIRRANNTVGLFSNYIVFAGHIKYALSKGYIPVIDMQNYPNAYLPPNLIGKENAWEYYFCQPLNIGLQQAYNGENVILNSAGDNPIPVDIPNDNMSFYNNKNNILIEWRMLIKLGLLKIKPELQKEIDNTYSQLFNTNDKVLGVILRGTDYVVKRPNGHPIPPPYRIRITKSYIKVA